MGEVASQRVVTCQSLSNASGNSQAISIVLLGAGKVATHLAPALVQAGYNLRQVWSRTEGSARMLAEPLGISYTDDLTAVTDDADVYIVCVTDGALPKVAQEIVAHVQRSPHTPLFLHTAGSVPMDVWREAGAKCYGILYPLQTFSKERVVAMREVSLFVEASDEASLTAVEALAHGLSDKVYWADSRRRSLLHVAAVFACNFTNAMYDAAHRLLASDDIPFDVLLPLIDETAAKVHALTPREAQTGPAVRGDEAVMQSHIQRLSDMPDLQVLYAQISKMIMNEKLIIKN